jgi:two-component system alkaline phosphatase synthesis response regulator PhoP
VATILIVDDEEPLRELLAMTLAESGHRTLQASQGRQALERVARDRPDLIISDVMMPVLNGRVLCQRLKEDPATQAIPVILMTSAGRQYASGVGADDCMDKPFDLDEMEALVRHWLLASGTADGTDHP